MPVVMSGEMAILSDFAARFAAMLEEQVLATKKLLDESMAELTNSVTQLSQTTAQTSSKAEATLAQTYLAPTDSAKGLMTHVQKSADDIFEQAAAAHRHGQTHSTGDQHDIDSERETRQLAGQFSKSLEAQSTLDQQLTSHMLNIMGILSYDDLLSQRLDHITAMLHFIAEAAITPRKLPQPSLYPLKIIEEIKKNTFALFTTTEERREFLQVFPTFTSEKKNVPPTLKKKSA